MIVSNPLRYLVFPLVAALLFFLVVAAQFSGKSSISHPFGSFVISGSAPSAAGADKVTDFMLSGLGVNIAFHGTSPLVIRTADNTDRSLRAKDYTLTRDELLVEFQYGVRLLFRLDRDDSLTGQVLLPPELAGSVLVRIPFASQILIPDTSGLGLPVGELRHGQQRYFLTLNGPGDRIELNRRFLELHPVADSFLPFRLQPAPARLLHAADQWLGETTSLEPLLATALETAFSSWRFARRRGSEGWLIDTGVPRVEPSIVTALLAEASRRELLQTVWNEIPANWRIDRNLEAAAWIGDIVTAWNRRRSGLETVLSRVLQGNWSDWADDATLLRDFYFMTDPEVFQTVWEAFRTRQPQTAEEAVSRLEALLLIREFLREEQVQPLLQDGAQTALRWLCRYADRLLLKNQRELLDYALTLRYAAALRQLGPAPSAGARSFHDLGNAILTQTLPEVQQGLLPRLLVPHGEGNLRTEGRFGLEEAARFLFPNPNWPKFTRLPSLPSGLLFAPLPASVVVRPEVIRLRTSHPPGTAQHLVIQGVPPFEYVTLHGIRWRSDPSFQSYSDGWAYDPASRTFFAKVTSRTGQVELVIQVRSLE